MHWNCLEGILFPKDQVRRKCIILLFVLKVVRSEYLRGTLSDGSINCLFNRIYVVKAVKE